MQNVVNGRPLPVYYTAEALLTNAAKKKGRREGGTLIVVEFGSGNNWQGSIINYILHVSHLLRIFHQVGEIIHTSKPSIQHDK